MQFEAEASSESETENERLAFRAAMAMFVDASVSA
jgi:hypothetical protein